MSISSISGINSLQEFSKISRSANKIALQDIVAIINNKLSASERKETFGSSAKITANDLLKAMKTDPYSKLSSIIGAINKSSAARKNTIPGFSNQILVQQLINALNKSRGGGSSRNSSGLDNRMKAIPQVNQEEILEKFKILEQKNELLEQKVKTQEEVNKLFIKVEQNTLKSKQAEETTLKYTQLAKGLLLQQRAKETKLFLQALGKEKLRLDGEAKKQQELKAEQECIALEARTLIMEYGAKYVFASEQNKTMLENDSNKYDKKIGFWIDKWYTPYVFQYNIGDIITFTNNNESKQFISKMPKRIGDEVKFICEVISRNGQISHITCADKGKMQDAIKSSNIEGVKEIRIVKK
jgi:hypothetical protein